MKLLQMCGAIAIATGVAAAPHVARAQALGEAATLSAGVSSAGSASGSTLGGSIGRAMGSAGSHMASSGRTSTTGGVVNLHWSGQGLKRSEKAAQTHAKDKAKSRIGSKNAHPDFVIFGADAPIADDTDVDSGHQSVSLPKAANHRGSSRRDSGRK